MHLLHTEQVGGSNPLTSTRLLRCDLSVVVSTSCCDLDSTGSNPVGVTKIILCLTRTINNSILCFTEFNADVAELVDALVLGTSIERCGGSSPFIRTKVIFPDGAAVAQLTVNQLVVGSNPTQGAKFNADVAQW